MTVTKPETVAELRRANALLQRQLDEHRLARDAASAREAALADVLNIINRTPGDPAPVFEAILAKAHSLCGASQGSLVTYDGESFRAVASHGLPDQFKILVGKPFGARPGRKGCRGGLV
jgi:hypothetical protein